MAGSRSILDLEAWSNSLPSERSNDLEFNLLIYKFRSLINEVRLFKEQHDDCCSTWMTNDISINNNNHNNNNNKSNSNKIDHTTNNKIRTPERNTPSIANNLSPSSISLSVQQGQDQTLSPLHSNYVNIDYFLRRVTSPTDDGDQAGQDADVNEKQNLHHDDDDDDEDEDDDDDDLNDTTVSSDDDDDDGDHEDEDTTHLSQSLSSDQNYDEVTPDMPDMSPRELARKLTSKVEQSSSTSTTPASSGDFFNNREPQPIHTSPQYMLEANNTMRSFLSDLNLSRADDLFEDNAQRRIVKESFAVEFCSRRKLRHLFLFNDVIVCAKYQASSKQKFTFDVKWYLNLSRVSILDVGDVSNQIKFDKEAMDAQILNIRTNLMLLRGQMQHLKRSQHKQPSKTIKKLKKKRTELEAELVLLLPHLPLVIKHHNGKKYTFFLSSNFDRNQWIESIKFLQSQLPPSAKGSASSPSSTELQAWIQTCRKTLNPTLGTFLLRSNCDDDLLYGDLYISLSSISGISKPGHYYFCFEVDSYGHFSQKASTLVLNIEQPNHELNEEYIFPLDGAHTLRILLYEDLGSHVKPSVVGKSHVELSRSWFLDTSVEKIISFNSSCILKTRLSYSSSELLSMRIPHVKLCPTFGMDITQVCKKEKTIIPLLIQLCVNEVERRGMREVGIYRMSGTSTDIQRLKKAFETNPHNAELLLRDIDINSVTGFLKTYLREIPEGLFSNKLYLRFVSAFNIPQSESLKRTRTMLELFHMIPAVNQQTIIYLVEHLVKVNRYEPCNKMSLTNLATVLGPNILKPPAETSPSSTSDPFTAVVIGSMSQAGILYFFLNRKYSNLPLMELDSSELSLSNTDNQSLKTPKRLVENQPVAKARCSVNNLL